MNSRIRKIVFWTLGMALIGVFLRAKGSDALTWRGEFAEMWPAILIGGGIGAVLGYVFSRKLPKVPK